MAADVFLNQPARIVAACGVSQRETAAETRVDFHAVGRAVGFADEELRSNAAACAFQYGHFFNQLFIQGIASGCAFADFAGAHFQTFARNGAFQTALTVVIHIDGKFGESILDIDVLGEHHFRVFGNIDSQISRCVDFFRTNGAAAVIRLGKTWENQAVPFVNFRRTDAVLCKQACGQALVAAQGNQFGVGNDDVYSFGFKTVACFGQLEQFGIDGRHNQADVVLFGQFENAVDVFGCVDARYAESAVGDMTG